MKGAIVKYDAPETLHHDVAQGVCDRVMHRPHNVEGAFLSLGRSLNGVAVSGRQGSGYRRQRILALTAHAGVGVAPRRGMVRFPTPFSDRGVLQEEHRGYLITEFVS
jgi:hypothetical protein